MCEQRPKFRGAWRGKVAAPSRRRQFLDGGGLQPMAPGTFHSFALDKQPLDLNRRRMMKRSILRKLAMVALTSMVLMLALTSTGPVGEHGADAGLDHPGAGPAAPDHLAQSRRGDLRSSEQHWPWGGENASGHRWHW